MTLDPIVFLVYGQKIDFGIFCRYVPQMNFTEYINGIYTVSMNGTPEIGKHIYDLLTGKEKLLSKKTPAFVEIRTRYAEKRQREKEEVTRKNAAEIERNRTPE